MDTRFLASKTDGSLAVGVGLVEGDAREEDLLGEVDFCPLQVFREAGEMMDALGAGGIGAAVRGSLPSDEFLAELAARHPGIGVRRIALLEPASGAPFLLGPVGVDEGGTMESVRALVGDMRSFCALLDWEPRIGVLSAGRPADAARGRHIAASIARGERAAAAGDVRHFHIMIEEALGWANCVIAPDGVSGNLIYRTLAHAGGATSLGALYFPGELKLADTSRSGKLIEYVGAVALANACAAAY